MDREREIELITRWRNFRDEEAGRQLWELVRADIAPRVQRTAVRLDLKNEYLDVLNETFEELRKNVANRRFDEAGQGRVSSYCFGIAHKKLLKINKERERRIKVLNGYKEHILSSLLDSSVGKSVWR